MTKINLNQDDLKKLTECINNQTEIPQDLLIKLSPSFFDKLYQEGKFDFQKLTKYKIPTIEYAGKRPESTILAQAAIVGEAAPLQVIRTFGDSPGTVWRNMIVQGDNLQFLKTCYLNHDPLIKDKVKGKVKLIYIDPPFGTKSDFTASNGAQSYADKVERAEFLEALRERLIYLREILDSNGSIYVHLDPKMCHYVKITMDEIFGKENFVNQIIWRKTNSPKAQSTELGNQHDTIYVYARNKTAIKVRPTYKQPDEDYLKAFRYDDKDGKGLYQTVALIAGSSQKTSGRKVFEWRGVNAPWLYTHENLEDMWAKALIVKTRTGGYRKKVYLCDVVGPIVSDLWVDREVSPLQGQSSENLGFPTQKPETLLDRIVRASSNETDLVLDCFAGSGTTAAVAEKLGRRWIMCDFGKHAIYTMQKRIWNIALSKKLGQEAKKNEKYGQPPNPFSIISAGVYDFSRIMNLRKNKEAYIDFVLGLFSIIREEKDYASKYKLSNIYAEKENNPVEVYPVWNDEYLKEVRIDEDYLKEIIRATGGRLKGDYYIVTPESCTIVTNTTLKNSNNEDVNFVLLKFPYKVLEDVSRHFQIKDQPASTGDINKLISSVGFYFNEEIEIAIEKIPEGFKIKHFSTGILDQNKEKYEGLQGLSMILIDKNNDGQVFNLDQAIYKNEITDEGIIKIEGLTKDSHLIAIDKHGNESKIIKI